MAIKITYIGRECRFLGFDPCVKYLTVQRLFNAISRDLRYSKMIVYTLFILLMSRSFKSQRHVNH